MQNKVVVILQGKDSCFPFDVCERESHKMRFLYVFLVLVALLTIGCEGDSPTSFIKRLEHDDESQLVLIGIDDYY